MLYRSRKTFGLTLIASLALSACGGDDAPGTGAAAGSPANGSGSTAKLACPFHGALAFECEPLFKYQWALKQPGSYFAGFPNVADGKTDLDLESVFRDGVFGQGVNLLVLDDGIDIAHEDLAPNVKRSMMHNFFNDTNDPTPDDIESAHGTHVAGIAAAAMNGKGVVGVAPNVNLGGARYLGFDDFVSNQVAAYGGVSWSANADIINASYGINPRSPIEYDTDTSSTEAVRTFPVRRNGKGLVMLKATGNEYAGIYSAATNTTRDCPTVGRKSGMISCENPANDPEGLEPGVIMVGAANAMGRKASYSNAGPINWITALGGEDGDSGAYGETGSGPKIFSTDLTGCHRGYSRYRSSADLKDEATNDFDTAGTPVNFRENPDCKYSSMNGTSAATPMVSGIVALMLSVNPKLTWRDVRDILRTTARKIDADYGSRDGRDARIDLGDGRASDETSSDLFDGATTARLDYGWQTNGAGNAYSTWYGFGLIDAAAAVRKARSYTSHADAGLTIPGFIRAFPDVMQMRYGQVQKLGQFSVSGNDSVDQLQLRLTGSVCIGSVGVYVKSPSGTISTLALPYNSYYKNNVSQVSHYGLGSYAFYGEQSAGTWEVYAVNAVPQPGCNSYDGNLTRLSKPLSVEYRIIAAR
ncbi:peptidase S8 [Burkholderia cepacia]|uniref:Peptidase S8 n=1 Tax=Burkholderia cepacia TaxID=292 RepID=A0A0J5WH84_BURCE|nr:S8 family serine peptidase [Burkholderia cepacia]KML48820.1 peptidase S8 [Burkholderia cepacia]